MGMLEGKLISREKVGEGYYHLVFSLSNPIDFLPGQFMVLMAHIHGENISRAYSIASSPSLAREGKIELCIKKVEGGKMSPYLCEGLSIGDKITMLGPSGNFTIKESEIGEYYFIATGSGIAPLRSMLLYLLENKNYKKITLIFGNRYKNAIPYHDFFESLSKDNKITYVPILSREPSWPYRGHVQDYIPRYISSKNGLFFICGSHNMVEDTARVLRDMGVKEDNIFYEKY